MIFWVLFLVCIVVYKFDEMPKKNFFVSGFYLAIFVILKIIFSRYEGTPTIIFFQRCKNLRVFVSALKKIDFEIKESRFFFCRDFKKI